MQELIAVIGCAAANGATAEQKAAGVQACRTIIAALDTEPGKPLVLPGTQSAAPLGRPSLDQMLDMIIAKLSMVAKERATHPAPASAPPSGLRVPVMQAAPRLLPRAATKPNVSSRAPAARKP